MQLELRVLKQFQLIQREVFPGKAGLIIDDSSLFMLD